MIRGVGIDLVDICAFRHQLSDPASGFIAATFTWLELSDVETRPTADSTPHLAARFAAKEAFIKAWSQAAMTHAPAVFPLNLREIEVTTDARHRPSLRLHGAVARAFQTLAPLQIRLSTSHDGAFATAIVLLEQAGEQPDL